MTLPVEVEAVLDRNPDACTLTAAQRPLRLAEFDDVFRTSVLSVTRPSPGLARLKLVASPELAATVASLAVRETDCCSFFTFTLSATGGVLSLEIAAPPERAEIVEALAARADQLRAEP